MLLPSFIFFFEKKIAFFYVVLHLSLIQISLFHCTSKFPYGNGRGTVVANLILNIYVLCLLTVKDIIIIFLSSVALEGSREDF